MIDEDTLTLLGLAIFLTQRFEFGLYGIAAHCSHLPEARKDKRFRELNPEKFLRGDISELRATMGQIVHIFGDRFLIAGDEIDAYVKRRNQIIHNFWRLTSQNSNSEFIGDPKQFLLTFIQETEKWQRIIGGLLAELKQGAAEKEGREDELVITESDRRNMREFHEFLANQLRKRML